MVPVRKPGRPLSTCACPPGRPCACGSVRVAIPKKQKCACPTGASDEACDLEEHSPAEGPSPSRPSFRVAKPVSAPKARSRKQSADVANLERMDPSLFNWITMPDNNGAANGVSMVSSKDQRPLPQPNGFGTGVGLMPARPGSSYAVPQSPSYIQPIPYQYAPSDQHHHAVRVDHEGLSAAPDGFSPLMPPPPFLNGSHGPLPVSVPAQPAVFSPPLLPKANGNTPQSGSCCCGKAEKSPGNVTAPHHGSGQPYAPPVQPLAIMKLNGGSHEGGSCCGGKATTPASLVMPVSEQGYGQSYMTQVHSSADVKLNANASNGNSCCGNKSQERPRAGPNIVIAHQQGYQPSYMASFQSPVDTKPQEHTFQYPTVFTYPAEYGSWQHPINPAIWQQVVSQAGAPVGAPIPPATNGDAENVITSHQCNCGEGCQCVGCLAHPFNAQMYQYVSDAYRASSNNGGSARGSSDNSPSAGTISGTGAADFGGGGAAPAQMTAGGHDSPLDAQTPSDGTSAREEEALSTTDYCFVDLPMWGICGGDLGSCPCGDSCECVGCLVHNNPLPQAPGS